MSWSDRNGPRADGFLGRVQERDNLISAENAVFDNTLTLDL